MCFLNLLSELENFTHSVLHPLTATKFYNVILKKQQLLKEVRIKLKSTQIFTVLQTVHNNDTGIVEVIKKYIILHCRYWSHNVHLHLYSSSKNILLLRLREIGSNNDSASLDDLRDLKDCVNYANVTLLDLKRSLSLYVHDFFIVANNAKWHTIGNILNWWYSQKCKYFRILYIT